MPIIQEGGRWRSVRTAPERQQSVDERVAKLAPAERLLLQKALIEWQTTGKSMLVEDVASVDWEEQPMPVRDWILNEDLIGETGTDMYPQLREDLAELFEGDYHEAILTGSTGWGKDYFATTACMRMLYELCCLRNPQHTLGLAAGEPIHIVPISRTVVSARRVVFGGIAKKLALAPWFRGKYEETMEEIRFRKKGILIVGGASQDSAALGLNTIFSIVDECLTDDAQILTPDGYFPISSLYDSSRNDKLTFGPIATYDEKTGEGRVDAGFIRPAAVTEVFEVELDDGRAIKATARHPFLVRRPWSDLDYVFLKDLKPGDEVIVVDPARQEWRPESVLWKDPHQGGEGEDSRGCAAQADGLLASGSGATQDRTLEPSYQGGERWHLCGRGARRGAESLCEGRPAAARTSSSAAGRKEAWTQDRRRSSANWPLPHASSGDAGRDRRVQGNGQPPSSLCDRGSETSERGWDSYAADSATESMDSRAAGWRRASYEEALVGTNLPGPDDRYQESLLSHAGVESEDRPSESEASGRVQALRGDEGEDQREFGVEGSQGELQVPGVGEDEEGDSEERTDGDRLPVAVGEACDEALGRILVRSQFPVRTVGRPVHLAGEEPLHDPRLSGEDGRRLDGDDRGQAEGLHLQREGTRQGRRLHAILRSLGLEVRSVGRATAVARIVTIRSAGSRQTFDVMSLPGGNFVANGIVVHNSNFLGEGKVVTGSSSGKAEDKATMIYNALARRVKNRYRRHGVKGMIMLVSSKRSTTDFTERRIREAVERNDRGVFARDYSVWDVHPEPFANQRWYRCSVSPKEGRCRVLSDEEPNPPGALVFKFPEDFLDEFKSDPDGCITGDTKIPLLDGREAAVADLVGIEEFWTYSYAPDGRLMPGRGHSARLTGRDAEIVEVELDDGQKIRCTADHRFMLRDGDYREARALVPGTSLMPLYRRVDRYGYEMAQSNVGGRWVHTHKIIARQAHNEGWHLPDGWVTHHRDFDKRNNAPENLVPMPEAEHTVLHAEGVKRMHTPEARAKVRAKLDERLRTDPAYRELLLAALAEARRVYAGSDKNREMGRRVGKLPKTLKQLATLRQNGTKVITALNLSARNPSYKQENREAASARLRAMPKATRHRATMAGLHARWKHDGPVEACAKCDSKAMVDLIVDGARRGLSRDAVAVELGVTKQAVYDRLKRANLPPYRKLQKTLQSPPNNHKVVAVRSAGRADVYDISVDTWNNFATSAGVVIHNSARDIAGIATDFVGQVFISRRSAIDAIFDRQRPNPFKTQEWTTGQILSIRWNDVMTKNARGDPVPVCCAGAIRHGHIDMSVNGYATGLAVAHQAGSVPVFRKDPETGEKIREDAPVIHVDGVLRIVAPDNGDIDQGEVRGVILRMISEGYPIRSMSMDQFCGPPNLQLFKRRGLRVEEVGERVAKLRPYLTLRQAIYEQRVVCPWHEGLDRELKGLEFDAKTNKVRHGAKLSKDLSDALAGVVYYITEHMQGDGPLGPQLGMSAPDRKVTGTAQWSSGGHVEWHDEDDGFDDLPAVPKKPTGDGEDYPACIIR